MSQATPQIITFFEHLKELDPGKRARLKRSAGQNMEEARQETVALFFSLLPRSVSLAHEGQYFLAATLFPLADEGGKGNLGDALRLARDDRNAKGLDRRVERLIDADEVQLPFRLRQTIHFLQSNRVRVNWPGLLEDLLLWSHPNRLVQRRWARSYFGLGETVVQLPTSNET